MSVKSQREMLEVAIAADFDDLAAHAGYADLLAEQGDPRGEWIQLHLALENKDQSPRLLAEWRQRAHRLLQKHERDWLGKLAPFLLSGPRQTVEPDRPNIEYTWKRGWLAELHVQDVRDAFTRVLADAPEARMLQVLVLRNTRLPNNRRPLEPLVDSPYLGNLKTFALGDPETPVLTADGEFVPGLVGRMPSLRRLDVRVDMLAVRQLFATRLPELWSLAVYSPPEFPLDVLAENRSLARLERLYLDAADWPLPRFNSPITYLVTVNGLQSFLAAPQFARLTDLTLRARQFGDDGCVAIAHSGILRRLKRLDLRHCDITDAGAEALARSPDLRHLEWLDVGGNRMTPIGVSRLQEAEIRVLWDSQWGDYPEPADDRDYIA